MTSHRATYANRFNARAIQRPKPTRQQILVAMTDEEFAAHQATLPTQLLRDLASITRAFGRAFATPPRGRIELG